MAEDIIELTEKGQYWTIILYPENMIDNWELEMPLKLQLPICWILHDKDLLKEKKEERKPHIHLMIVANNNTTAGSILRLIKKLDKNHNKPCYAITTFERVVKVRKLYDYFCHDTDECRKQRKHRYKPEERKTANNFDIGTYEQISLQEKQMARDILADYIIDQCITDARELHIAIRQCFLDPVYRDVESAYSGYFDKLMKGNWHYKQKTIK